MRQVTKKRCSHVLYSCMLHRKHRQPRGGARKTIGNVIQMCARRALVLWDPAQLIHSDENHRNRANLWITLPFSSAMNLPSTKSDRAAAASASSAQRRGKRIQWTTILSVAHFMGRAKLFMSTDPSGGLVALILLLSSGHRCGESTEKCNAERGG